MSQFPRSDRVAGGAVAKVRDFRSTLLCVAILLVCVLVSHPVAETGMGDDFAYIWAAKVLAATGHVVYTGAATAMLTWQLYLGALFIKLFGFSFTVVRASVTLVSLMSTAMLHRIFLRMGLGDWNASIVTLSIVLSPLFLPLATTFMSDVPGLMAVLVCLYFCLRAIQTQSERATIAWLVAAAVSNDLLGTVRQISWLGALVLVPSAAWCLRRRRGVPVTALALWLLSLVFIAGCMHWFEQQPYALHEDLFFSYHRGQLMQVWTLALAAIFTVLPVLSAFALPSSALRSSVRYWTLFAGALAGCGILLLDHSRGFDSVSSLIVFYAGAVPFMVKLALTGLSFACLFCFVAELRGAISNVIAGAPSSVPTGAAAVPARTWIVLLGPFTCAYMFLVVTRDAVWPRYLVTVLPMFVLLLLWVYTRNAPQRRLPMVSVAVIGVFAILAVANTHDMFAYVSASNAAVNNVMSAGIPRTAIEGGFGLDGWAQLEVTGYVNDSRVPLPVGAYRPRKPSGTPPECHNWFFDWTPSIQPRFEITSSPSSCFPPASFAPVHYRAWYPPHDRAIYISTVPD